MKNTFLRALHNNMISRSTLCFLAVLAALLFLPGIALADGSLSITQGLDMFVDDYVTLTNESGDYETYGWTSDSNWVVPQMGISFSLNPGESAGIRVYINGRNLFPGSYSGTFTITGNRGTEMEVPVDLSVLAPVISHDPPSITAKITQGFMAGAVPLIITNEGNVGPGQLHYVVSSNRAWLGLNTGNTLDLSDGQNGSVSVHLYTSGLPVGTHTGKVYIDCGDTRATVSATITVAKPNIQVNPGSVNGTTRLWTDAGYVDLEFRNEGNEGAGSLLYVVSSNKSWLGLNTGTTAYVGPGGVGYVRVHLYTSGLPVGTHTGEVYVTCGDAQKTLPATVEIVSYTCSDGDGDGYYGYSAGQCTMGRDCNDNSRPDIYPGAIEICDTVDNDCDGVVDEKCCPGGDEWCKYMAKAFLGGT